MVTTKVSDNDVLVKVQGISKKFCRDFKKSLWYGLKDIFSAADYTSDKSDVNLRPHEFFAIRDISFELRRGECIGLIGHNGAGKSTLLKILTGLIHPDKGSVEMRGRVGALIELGAGFDPILTGRENIYNNGAVLGFSKKEIDARIDEIIAFSEIGESIDSPVQNYSSGMKVRLGFAVASQMEPDILIIDEVLAVGDVGFVLKCFNRMDRILQNTAIIFVSHSMPQVSRICSSIILMDGGKSVYQGNNTSEGIDRYYSQFKTESMKAFNTGDVKLHQISINGVSNTEPVLVKINRLSDVEIKVCFEVEEEYRNPEVSVSFFDKEMRNVAEYVREDGNGEIINNGAGLIVILIKIPCVQFSKGIYSITLGITEKRGGRVLFRQQSIASFQIISDLHMWSAFQLHGETRQVS